MNRWSNPLYLLCTVTLAFASLLVNLSAQAQVRNFPNDVARGTVTFVAPPQVLVNNRSEFLAPGVRVRNEQNLLALTGSLLGKTFLVNYLRDPAGLIREIWILTPDEAGTSASGSTSGGGTPALYLGG